MVTASPIPAWVKLMAGDRLRCGRLKRFDLDRGSRLNLFISGTETSIMMIEGEADFLTEEQMTAAIDVGMSVIRQLCRGLKAFAARCALPIPVHAKQQPAVRSSLRCLRHARWRLERVAGRMVGGVDTQGPLSACPECVAEGEGRLWCCLPF
jgi:hypothetical protein